MKNWGFMCPMVFFSRDQMCPWFCFSREEDDFLAFSLSKRYSWHHFSHHLKLVAEGKPSMPPSWVKRPTSLTSHMPQVTTYNSKGKSWTYSPLGNISIMLANFVEASPFIPKQVLFNTLCFLFSNRTLWHTFSRLPKESN
jgi:hypothetical protein